MGHSQQRKGAEGERELARVMAVGLPGIHIECKRVERLNLHDAMAQAERDSERFQDGVPAVFHRRSRSPWLVTMKLEDWGRLYSV